MYRDHRIARSHPSLPTPPNPLAAPTPFLAVIHQAVRGDAFCFSHFALYLAPKLNVNVKCVSIIFPRPPTKSTQIRETCTKTSSFGRSGLWRRWSHLSLLICVWSISGSFFLFFATSHLFDTVTPPPLIPLPIRTPLTTQSRTISHILSALAPCAVPPFFLVKTDHPASFRATARTLFLHIIFLPLHIMLLSSPPVRRRDSSSLSTPWASLVYTNFYLLDGH